MNASNAIRERVDRFVDEILSLTRRVQEEHRAMALRTVTTMLTDLGQRASRVPSERPPKRRSAHTKKTRSAPVTATQHATRSRAPRSWATGTPAKQEASTSMSLIPPLMDEATLDTKPSASDREAVVLETVRSLVRGTATEIATHTGLPNGSVYVALRALVARGRVARAETARGVEYSLVSSGEIRPFKRVRATTPPAPGEVEQAVEQVAGVDEEPKAARLTKP